MKLCLTFLCFVLLFKLTILWDDIVYGFCNCEGVEYEPVCGSNGYTFPNRCRMLCANVEFGCSGKCPCAGAPTVLPKVLTNVLLTKF